MIKPVLAALLALSDQAAPADTNGTDDATLAAIARMAAQCRMRRVRVTREDHGTDLQVNHFATGSFMAYISYDYAGRNTVAPYCFTIQLRSRGWFILKRPNEIERSVPAMPPPR